MTTTNAGTAAGASATLTVIAAPTAAKSFAPASIAPNATSVLTIVLTNPNAIAITGAAFTDNYPAGLVNTAAPQYRATTGAGCVGTVTAAAGGNTLTLSGGTIPAFASCTITVNVTAAARPGPFQHDPGRRDHHRQRGHEHPAASARR